MTSTTSRVNFGILLNNQHLVVSAQLTDSLATLYKSDDVSYFVPNNVPYTKCQFYRVKNPVSIGEDSTRDIPNEVKERCRNEDNMQHVNPATTKVKKLATKLSDDCIYLVIEVPDPLKEAREAVEKLRETRAELFECLQATVENLGNWYTDDVERNLNGGTQTDNTSELPPEFQPILEALANKRVYQAAIIQTRDYDNAHFYEEFSRVFVLAGTDQTHTVISGREFAAFYNVLRCFNEDVSKIVHKSASSSLKASNFTVHFVQPPFFSENNGSRGFTYQQEKSWGFPIFVRPSSVLDYWTRFTPRSDWMVVSPQYDIPFVISEVISQEQQQDRSRMLIQAIALARTGQFLMQSTSKRRFFVVAIYVDAHMVASRYIVMQTGLETTTNANPLHYRRAVCIHQKDFDLQDKGAQVDLLCEMYNLATQIAALSGDFDQTKKGSLAAIKQLANPLQTLTASRTTKHLRSSHLESVREEGRVSSGPQDNDRLVFHQPDVQAVLRDMDYEIEDSGQGLYPHVTLIVHKTGSYAYLKFVRQDREKEVKVLQTLAGIRSPSNHTISGVRSWPVQGGTMISMPVAGGHLTSLTNPDEHLWPVALQLFEAVAFMHAHHVAHMDLKPGNIIIPPEGGRLSIIDFSVSIPGCTPDLVSTGVIGTEGYMAPEVRRGEQYWPMLADLWSCGQTLTELCARCKSSPHVPMLLGIARELMNPDPTARPTMTMVLESLAHAQRGEGDVVVSPMLQCPSVPAVCG